MEWVLYKFTGSLRKEEFIDVVSGIGWILVLELFLVRSSLPHSVLVQYSLSRKKQKYLENSTTWVCVSSLSSLAMEKKCWDKEPQVQVLPILLYILLFYFIYSLVNQKKGSETSHSLEKSMLSTPLSFAQVDSCMSCVALNTTLCQTQPQLQNPEGISSLAVSLHLSIVSWRYFKTKGRYPEEITFYSSHHPCSHPYRALEMQQMHQHLEMLPRAWGIKSQSESDLRKLTWAKKGQGKSQTQDASQGGNTKKKPVKKKKKEKASEPRGRAVDWRTGLEGKRRTSKACTPDGLRLWWDKWLLLMRKFHFNKKWSEILLCFCVSETWSSITSC